MTIIIPYRDNRTALVRLLNSLPKDIRVIVVDDCSDSKLRLRREGVEIIRREERGFFSGAVNTGAAACDDDMLILNQDVWFTRPEAVNRLFGWPDGIACAGDPVLGHPCWPKGYVQGTCMWISRKAWNEVGPFDEKHWPLWGATAEWQLRACRKGWKFELVEMPEMVHARGERPFGDSIAKLLEEEPEKKSLYIRTPPIMSVVVPCYNYGRYLPELIASLLGGESVLGTVPPQTFQGFEIILVDDRSADNTWEYISSIADSTKGIIGLRRAANGGTAAALNSGIKVAHGKYIVTVDSDDMLPPDSLETFLEHLENDDSKLYYGNTRKIEDGTLSEEFELGDYDFVSLLNKNVVPSCTAFSKYAWEQSGGYPERFANGRQDWAFAVAMGSHGFCGERIPKTMFYYRRHGTNRSRSNSDSEHMAKWHMMMRETFPAVYGGNMAGCCGGRRAVPVKTAGLSAQKLTPGAEGMTLLVYEGKNTGRLRLKGAATGTNYVIKGTNRKFYADSKDVPGLLDYVENRQYVIKPAAEAKEPVIDNTIEEVVG